MLAFKVLAYTKGLSVQLQGRYNDVDCAYRVIETVKAAVASAQSDVDVFHSSV